MSIDELKDMAAKARDLPRLLVVVPPGELTPEVKANVLTELQAQLNDNHLCEKLGRAFLLGRLHRQMDVELAATPPLDTLDECNLYAGGYQYDGDVNPILDAIIEREQLQEDERVEKFADLMARYEALGQRRIDEGATPEILEESFMLRMDMQSITVANLISRMRILEARVAGSFGDLAALTTELDVLANQAVAER